MPGLINLLLQVLESSKRNISVVEKLIFILEQEAGDCNYLEEQNEIQEMLKTSEVDRYQSSNFREDNLPWNQTSIYMNNLEDMNWDSYNDDPPEFAHSKSELGDGPEESLCKLHIQTDERIGFTGEAECEDAPESEQKPESEMITPLSKFSFEEQHKLLFSIFLSAKNNVRDTIGISEQAECFEEEVQKEADRLFQLWLESQANPFKN